MKSSLRASCSCLTATIILFATSCGRQSADSRDPQPTTPFVEPNGDAQSSEQDIVRGQWMVPVHGPGSANQQFVSRDVSHGTSKQPIQGKVEAAVQFEVSNSNFSTPTTVGEASYGTLDVKKLSDNAINVCGTAGNARCVEAVIRVYTTGTPGNGLWNAQEKYGLPISMSGQTIGLNSTAAAIVVSKKIATDIRVLKLSDIAGTSELKIPISVNFTDAVAGEYSSTLVVEYVVR